LRCPRNVYASKKELDAIEGLGSKAANSILKYKDFT